MKSAAKAFDDGMVNLGTNYSEQRASHRVFQHTICHYALSVVSVAVALAITLSLGGYTFRTPFFFPAIILSTWIGGIEDVLQVREVPIHLENLLAGFGLSRGCNTSRTDPAASVLNPLGMPRLPRVPSARAHRAVDAAWRHAKQHAQTRRHRFGVVSEKIGHGPSITEYDRQIIEEDATLNVCTKRSQELTVSHLLKCPTVEHAIVSDVPYPETRERTLLGVFGASRR